MGETLIIASENTTKEEKYKLLFFQLEALIAGETDLTANLANICAALKATFNFFWVGFYLVKGKQLVLGPFQGPLACTRIDYGKGVCGTSWKQKQTILVENVEEFPGHIACSSLSKSEIVIPIIKNGDVAMVLDIDSDKLADFDDTDREFLERLASLLVKLV